MMNKVLIVIASRNEGNVYSVTEPFFHNIKTSYDVVVRSELVTGAQRNFKKWQDAFIEHSNYAYYMFLHDDCREFQSGWLDVMLSVLKENYSNGVGGVCHQLYSPGGFEAKYNNPPFGLCNCNDAVSMYGNNSKTHDIIWTALHAKFKNKAKFLDLAGGEQMLLSNEVVMRLQEIGGIPCPEEVSKWDSSLALLINEPQSGGAICERIFCGCINSLGYRILDCRVNGKPPFKHSTIL